MIRQKEINDDLALRCFFMVAFSNLRYTNTDSIIRISDVVWNEDIGQIIKINWCKAMIDDMRTCGRLFKMDKSKRLAKSVDHISICGCLLFLVVSFFSSFFYLISLYYLYIQIFAPALFFNNNYYFC
jgi:hypothetical protein